MTDELLGGTEETAPIEPQCGPIAKFFNMCSTQIGAPVTMDSNIDRNTPGAQEFQKDAAEGKFGGTMQKLEGAMAQKGAMLDNIMKNI